MPDPFVIGQAVLLSAGVAGVLLLLLAWPWRVPQATRLSLGWALGTGAGFLAGLGLLGVWPRWPPLEDRYRLLMILLPATIATEAVAAFSAVPRWLAWLLRLTVAAMATPILLHQTTFLADLSGPGSREWSGAQAVWILGGLAAGLGAVWMLLGWLQARSSGRVVALAIALSAAAAGVAVMFSGYRLAGEMGLPLAAALAGATLASFAVSAQPHQGWSLGVGIVGLFSVLLLGRCFGTLSTSWALSLMLAPLLAWVPECPGLGRLGPRIRFVAQLVLVAIPLVFVVVSARQKFTEEFNATSSPGDSSLEQEYMNFGK
jgi:hypothetical protein